MSEPLLVARDVAVRRGSRLVVEGVNLSIERGRVYLLRGPNGAGKTSLLRVFAGFSKPASGTVDTTEQTAAFLGHADGVKGALTVAENIRFWNRLYRDGAKADLSAPLNLATFRDRRAATLSAGQRRRLALSRIVLSGRPLWLLDEPTAGMDAASIAATIALVAEHCAHRGAAIVATHEPLAFRNAVTITLEAT